MTIRGPFVAVEGGDGTGKTEQVRRLLARLDSRCGLGAIATREPSEGPIGRLIRDYLTRAVTLDPGAVPALFAADRRDHVAREIAPVLARGCGVVCDRYTLSNVVYRGAETPGPLLACSCGWTGEPRPACPRCYVSPVPFTAAVQARMAWARSLDSGLCAPDVTVVLMVPAAVASMRRRTRGGAADRYENEQMQARCGELYGRAAELGCGNVCLVDGCGEPSVVASRVWGAVEPRLLRPT